MTIRFGTAGNAQSFYDAGYKKTIQAPEFIEKVGLNAYEYQCGRGVRIKKDAAEEFGAAAREKGVALSVHAPYYISLSSPEEEKRENSISYILQSARAAMQMGAKRVVVHSGSCAKRSREEALELAKDTLKRALIKMDEEGLGRVHLCPETMGKTNQLGTLSEVLALCGLDERLIPCIDFGHLNARTFGGLETLDDFKAVFDEIEDRLGMDRMRRMHVHFSKIAWTEKGGEKVHLTFADTEYGPSFEPAAELFAQKNCAPVIICESAGTQAEDALQMKQMYEEAKAHLLNESAGC